MLNDEVYEVSRDEFKGFITQIKPECFDHTIENTYNEDTYNIEKQVIMITSKDGQRTFGKMISTNDDTHYYIYEMPYDDERRPATPVRIITLGSVEDVKNFFQILNQLQEQKKND